MKRLVPLLLIIVVAVLAGFFVATYQKQSLITSLIESSSVTDQLRGIELLEDYSLNALQQILLPIIDNNTEASMKAQNLLVKSAFHEDRIQDLQEVHLNKELYEAALWWNSPREEYQPFDLSVYNSFNPSPWVIKLVAHYDSHQQQVTYSDLLELPLRDRDGSVLLSVLAIERIAPQKIKPLIESWSLDYDIDRQKAAVLLAAMRGLALPMVSTQNETLSTIQKIITDENIELAWRSLHRKDGTIHPDTALAGMIIDQKTFTPILIKSVQDNKWTHPEHAILIVHSFFPEITNQISIELLKNPQARQKWWSLFACGLLQEER